VYDNKNVLDEPTNIIYITKGAASVGTTWVNGEKPMNTIQMQCYCSGCTFKNCMIIKITYSDSSSEMMYTIAKM